MEKTVSKTVLLRILFASFFSSKAMKQIFKNQKITFFYRLNVNHELPFGQKKNNNSNSNSSFITIMNMIYCKIIKINSNPKRKRKDLFQFQFHWDSMICLLDFYYRKNNNKCKQLNWQGRRRNQYRMSHRQGRRTIFPKKKKIKKINQNVTKIKWSEFNLWKDMKNENLYIIIYFLCDNVIFYVVRKNFIIFRFSIFVCLHFGFDTFCG